MNVMLAQHKFDKLAAAFGNKYAAVMYISKLARHLAMSSPYSVLDSAAITWATTGEIPQCAPVKNVRNTLDPISDTLCLVDNAAIQEAVLDSLRLSLHHYLLKYNTTLYNYNKCVQYTCSFMSTIIREHVLPLSKVEFVYNDVAESDKSRVRILTRMIWTNF